MKIIRSKDPQTLGTAAGNTAVALIKAAIAEKGSANIILATGTSQFETIRQLIASDIDWGKVNMFHLDEYIGLPVTHPASFRKYLRERFLDKVAPLQSVCLINGEGDPEAECSRISALIQAHPIDVALVGIGENGHLAFNDPPADFNTTKPYLVVNLDAACRQQQMNEGWFSAVTEVPLQAISMSVHQILLSKHIICSVPGERKAQAVKDSLEQPVSNLFPASILQTHADCVFYLDEASAAKLQPAQKTV
ncbi:MULTISPECIES: glucosamine-6-phosphate deaminase [Chitinophaga]|uniref:glucosamine-6-phosphate deaminase n=1 Tax=Chitinophaga TaxID=79328 RepID=UPI000DB9D3A5|nr:glucosamine-6-phosphate deaminase [Chitinophaga ginsengisegetis]MDR6566910.1 glucosamine-6-phosphate deaminase [Chitinophaga ginsengisegetis]MDR6646640.1 glucosamine-6-phosphate deaminase [Chitinophaga ginsengisegetis]MDR6652990.1 glucosamine-6-phosphate deaminase [Chitinophaga ginsengisegetis]